MYRQKIKSDLRQRFRNEYLGTLAFSKNKNIITNKIKVGDIVLIGNDNSKRMDWPLARVKELIYSDDNKIRIVKLITASGELTRPIQRLYPLEISYNANDSDGCDSLIKHIDSVKDNTRDSPNITKPVTITRSGRQSKEPERLMYY
jgi:hypothetical protein